MPLNFPSNPSPGQTASVGGRTWTWNGNAWAVVTSLGQGNLESFSGNVIPSHNELYDLGHNERKWKHLYLGGNSLHIGNTSIRSDSNGVSLTSFSNSNIAVPISVESIKIGSGSNVITLVSTTGGLQTVDTYGNAVPIGGGSGATVSVTGSAPGSPTVGTFWLDSDTGDLSVYYNDTWIGVSDYFGSITGATGPIGATGPQGPAGVLDSVEIFTALSNSSGTVNHDFLISTVYHHDGLTGNITVNFSNVPTTNNRIVNFVVIVYQKATAYNIATVQVNGITQAVNWFDNSTPTGVANKKEVYSFNLLRLASSWYIHGSQSQYG